MFTVRHFLSMLIKVNQVPPLQISYLINLMSQLQSKIQQTKMLVTCQMFGNLFLFGLVWQNSSVQTKYNKGRFKVMATYCSSNISLSLHSYTGSALKRELNFSNGYLSLLYFWLQSSGRVFFKIKSVDEFFVKTVLWVISVKSYFITKAILQRWNVG